MTKTWKILLIDDDEADRLTFRRIMKEEGIAADLRVACDGAAALSMLFGADGSGAADRPDIAVLDLNMGGVGGLEVLKRLKADPKTQTIPVIVLTTSADPRDIDASYAAGASSYIVKPASIEGFRKVVRGLAAYWSELVTRPL